MADGRAAFQAGNHFGLGKDIADQAMFAFGIEALAVTGGDAARFLAAMLEGVHTEDGNGAGVIYAKDAKYPAFKAGAVIVGVTLVGLGIGESRQFRLRQQHGISFLKRSDRPHGETGGSGY